MKAYVISLARSAERRAHMAQELSRTTLEHEFVEGIEGTSLDLSDERVMSPISLGRGLVQDGALKNARFWPGVVGCALSHLKVYRKVLADGAENALVLEDDVLLPADLDEIAEAAAAHMTGPETVLLQYGNGSVAQGHALRLNRATALQLPGARLLASPAEIADVYGAAAYVITREACELMASLILPVRVPADDWAFFLTRRALQTVRCVAPVPVVVDPRFRTTIDHFAPRSLQTYRRQAAQRIPIANQILTRRRQRVRTETELVDCSSSSCCSGGVFGGEAGQLQAGEWPAYQRQPPAPQVRRDGQARLAVSTDAADRAIT